MFAVLAAGGAMARADLIITEFMASNTTTLVDQDQAYSDWIEIHNPDAIPVNLNGWYLTDTASNKTRWQFPAVTLVPGGYVVVFASNKNRRDPTAELHTNFGLANEGEYLALIKPDGVTVATEFAPAFPAQTADVSYGLLAQPTGGWATAFFATPTPGLPNLATGTAELSATIRFSHPPGPFSAPFNLELSGAGPGQHIRYVSVPSSTAGAIAPEPSETSPRYLGPLAIDAPALVRAAVFSDDLKSHGLSRAAMYSRLDLTSARNLANLATKLPILVMEQHGYGGLEKADLAQPMWLYGYPPADFPFRAAPELVAQIRSAVRGSSSANFPKKSYNLTFVNDAGKSTALPILGFRPYDEWVLVGPWYYDPSFLRNAFIYEMSNRLGRWAPRTKFVELFLNPNGFALDTSAYLGVYVLTDKIDIHPDRVAIDRLAASALREPEITGGYVLKIDLPDANEYSWKTERWPDYDSLSSVVVTSPKIDKLPSAQRDYIRGYVQKLEHALHAGRASGWRDRTYLDYLDRPSWVDHHILNTFAANPDAFERSAYFHKPRGGKLFAGPVWDFDRALGSSHDERSLRWDRWFGENAVQPWDFGWWGVLATDPEFMQDWIDRWQSLRRDQFSSSRLTALADQLAMAIGPEAAARDAAHWVDNVSLAGGTHAGEMAHLKNWLVKRAEWIDAQFVAPPVVTLSGESLVIQPTPGTQLAYTLDGSDPRALGGDVAPGTTLSSTRVTVPATANLHVRNYRASPPSSFPGSPWSSAVGGASSSPLSPTSRLANISTRAVAGSGDNALIVGVVVVDTAGKAFLARGIGPGLASFGVSGTVPDPQLSLFANTGTELYRNVGWQSGPDAIRLPPLTRSVGAFPLADRSGDSAVIATVAGGAYTVQVTSPSGQTGLGLAELYETDGLGRTVNLSTRALVGLNERVLIGGFVVAGTAYRRMLVRAVGPTLSQFGVTNVLADPVLTLYSGATTVASNDRWSTGPTAAAITSAGIRVGAFVLPANSEDAALLISVAPGAYTAEVRGKGNTEGVALLEIYEVP